MIYIYTIAVHFAETVSVHVIETPVSNTLVLLVKILHPTVAKLEDEMIQGQP